MQSMADKKVLKKGQRKMMVSVVGGENLTSRVKKSLAPLRVVVLKVTWVGLFDVVG